MHRYTYVDKIERAVRLANALRMRLFLESVVYIASHASDQVVFVDASLLPALELYFPFLWVVFRLSGRKNNPQKLKFAISVRP